MKLTILVPAYNESLTIEPLLQRLAALDLDKEIIVIDDGSTDQTFAIASRIAGELPALRVLRQSKNQGKGAAIRRGLEEATGDAVVIQDADLEYDPQDIVRLWNEMVRRDHPVIYGSRRLGGPSEASRRRYYVGGVLLSWLTNCLYGSRLTDEPTCYKMVRTDLLRSLDLQCTGFEFCPEVTAKILRRGIEIPELRISYRPRGVAEGKKIRAHDALEAAWILLKYRLAPLPLAVPGFPLQVSLVAPPRGWFYTGVLLLLATFGLYLRCWDLDKPFAFGARGSTEWLGFDNGAFYGVGALHQLRFGYLETKLACLLRTAAPGRITVAGATARGSDDGGTGELPSKGVQPFFYVRHPPLLTLALSVMFALLGATHVVARLLPIAFSIVALLGVARIARRLWGLAAGLAAAVVMACLPAGAFYGSLVDPQGSLVMGFTVLAADAYLSLLQSPKKRFLALSLLWTALACLTDWPGYFVAGLIGLHQLVIALRPRESEERRGALSTLAAFGLLVTVLFALHLWQTMAVGGSKQGGMAETLLHHSLMGIGGSPAQPGYGAGLAGFLATSVTSIIRILTIPGALVGFAGLIWLLRRHPGESRGKIVPFILTGMAVLHIVVFAEAARRHLYWFVYLLPPLALGAAYAFFRLGSRAALSRRWRLVQASFVAVLGIGAFGVERSVALQFEPDPYFMHLGGVIQRETRPDHWVLTSEFPQISLRFYADRWIYGKLADDRLGKVPDMDAFVKLLVQDGPTVFFMPEGPSYPGRRTERIRAALDKAFPKRAVESPIGTVWVYELRE
ncbi:MAG: glycosyltransferase [Planctomycetota bacterium]